MPLAMNDKLRRILSFLIGARNPRIFAVLATRGFTQTDLDEGWELFTVAAGSKLSYTGQTKDPLAPDMAREHLAVLDEWENTWFPVVAATLERHAPALHEKVFNNLGQTEGNEVLVSVSTMLDRLGDLKKTELGAKMTELLAQRGLTPAVKDTAASLIQAIKQAGDVSLPEIDPGSLEEQVKAQEDVWAWYREWGQIARTVIDRGDILIRLGLRQITRTREEEEEEAPETVQPQS